MWFSSFQLVEAEKFTNIIQQLFVYFALFTSSKSLSVDDTHYKSQKVDGNFKIEIQQDQFTILVMVRYWSVTYKSNYNAVQFLERSGCVHLQFQIDFKVNFALDTFSKWLFVYYYRCAIVQTNSCKEIRVQFPFLSSCCGLISIAVIGRLLRSLWTAPYKVLRIFLRILHTDKNRVSEEASSSRRHKWP